MHAGRTSADPAVLVEAVVDVVEVPTGTGEQVDRGLGGLHEVLDAGRVGSLSGFLPSAQMHERAKSEKNIAPLYAAG